MNPNLAFIICATALLATGAFVPSASASDGDPPTFDPWTQRSEGCEERAFQTPAGAPARILATCARVWEAYKVIASETDPDLKNRVIMGFKRLYLEGNDDDAHLARLGLARLGVMVPARVPKAAAIIVAAGPKREKCDPPTPGKSQIKAAKKAFKKGFKAYKKGNNETALKHYLAAVDAAPGWPKGIYNAAAIHGLLGQEDAMIEKLFCLSDIDSDASIRFLRKARTDSDFEGIRDTSAGFKVLTQYAKIKMANSIGEYGEDNVDNIVATLEALQYPVEQVVDDPTARAFPHVWYKAHSAAAAYIIVKVLNHPGTVLRPISWADEEYDILVSWGDKVKEGDDPIVRVQDPDDSENLLKKYKKAERDALSEPGKGQAQADGYRSQTEGQVDQVEDSINQVDDGIEKASDAVDTLKGLF